MENVITVEVVNSKIGKLAKAEKVTKALLGELSRDLLTYVAVQESWDVAAINRLLAVLTPMNKKTAVLFFDHFLPFVFSKEDGTFGAMAKNKEKKAKDKGESIDKVGVFLADEDNNIWTYAEENIKVEQKPVDYAAKITADVKKALDPEKGGMDLAHVLEAVLAAGVDAQGVLDALGELYQLEVVADAEAQAA